MKYATWFGAVSGVRSMMKVPIVVSITACLGGVCACAMLPMSTEKARRPRRHAIRPSNFFFAFSCLRGFIASTLDDPRDHPNVMKTGHERDCQRRVHEYADHHGRVTEVVIKQCHDRGKDVGCGCDFS